MRIIPRTYFFFFLLSVFFGAWARAGTTHDLIETFAADLDSLQRYYELPYVREDHDRTVRFLGDYQKRLASVPFEKLSRPERIDYLLFDAHLKRSLFNIRQRWDRYEEIADWTPFRSDIVALLVDRRKVHAVEGRRLAERIEMIREKMSDVRSKLGKRFEAGSDVPGMILARRTRNHLSEMERDLDDWGKFHQGYNPTTGWWIKQPYADLKSEIRKYEDFLSKKIMGMDDAKSDEPVIGDPIGKEALVRELQSEFIAYGPEKLIEIANKEFEWCVAEARRAAGELGFGEDYRKALNHVKNQYVPPGQQPNLIKNLANEAIKFLEDRDLVTIPELCKETWEMQMMTPARQKVNPYFLGGQTIIVSFPTDGMAHQDKLMSLRGNNRHFAKATVHHELIPGHHLQIFMAERHAAHRKIFRTPFLVEGWALYWEMLLWDLGFPQSPEDRMGMLFWRMHRCARIIFSLNFHLKEMTAAECIDFLVENVGHERRNATAEVRRSVGETYPPLYQAAYMLGGLQIRALRRELVDSGKMNNKQFHDAILLENSIPIDMIRASLLKTDLSRDHTSNWKFYE